MPSRLLIALGTLALTACGASPSTTDSGATPPTDAAADAAANAPPRWTNAPATLSIGQGQHSTLTVALSDPENDAVTHAVTAPPGLALAIDGEGAATRWNLSADYTLTGPQAVTIESTDARGARATHSVEVTVRPLSWLPRAQWGAADPQAREHAALMVDAEHNQLLMLGGSGYQPYGTPLGDAWRFDLVTSTWRPATVDGDVPAPAGSRRVAPMPDGRSALLFGGYGASNAANNELFRVTFREDGATVRRLEQRTPPSARSLHAFAYDPVSRRFAVFGGAGRLGPLGDTWIMTLDGDVASWTELATEDAPSPRYGFFSGFDAERGRLVVFSGAQGFNPLDPAADTWALDLRSDPPAWRRLASGDEPGSPPGRRNGVSVWDPTGPRLFVFGGTADARTSEPGLWAFDATPGAERWARVEREMAPPVRSSAFGVFDAARNRVVFGFGNTTSAVYRDLAFLQL